MSDTVQFAILMAALNGAVTWGVVSTKLAWLRSDIDAISRRVEELEHIK